MDEIAAPLSRLIEELKRLPAIGQKSAQRIAFHLLRADRDRSQALAEALLAVKDNLRLCGVCNNVTDVDPCRFCAGGRDAAQICVVEQPQDVWAVEKTRQFRGAYHVLHGALSPLQGIGPDQIKIQSLVERLRERTPAGDAVVREIILATDPDAEGEATAVYLAQLLKPLGVKVSRIATGIPMGTELDYADQITMQKALEGRRPL